MVGLIPLFAVETLEPELLDQLPDFNRRLKWFLNYRPDLAKLVSRWEEPGRGERRLLSLLRGHRMKRLLQAHARRDRVPLRLRRAGPVASTTATSPTRSTCRRHALTVALPAGRVGLGPVRRQLELARADLVPGQLPDHRVAAEVPPLLRRRLQGRVPHRLGPASSPSARWPTSCRGRLTRLFLRDEQRPPAGLRRPRQAADRPALPRPPAVPRVLPRRHRPRRGRVPPDRLDRPGRQAVAAAAAAE